MRNTRHLYNTCFSFVKQPIFILQDIYARSTNNALCIQMQYYSTLKQVNKTYMSSWRHFQRMLKKKLINAMHCIRQKYVAFIYYAIKYMLCILSKEMKQLLCTFLNLFRTSRICNQFHQNYTLMIKRFVH